MPFECTAETGVYGLLYGVGIKLTRIFDLNDIILSIHGKMVDIGRPQFVPPDVTLDAGKIRHLVVFADSDAQHIRGLFGSRRKSGIRNKEALDRSQKIRIFNSIGDERAVELVMVLEEDQYLHWMM